MEIVIEVKDEVIGEWFKSPQSRYWCSELVYSNGAGTCVESEGDIEHPIGPLMTKSAIKTMIEKGEKVIFSLLAGNGDALDRDIFLQYVVFGEVKYG